MFSFYEIAINYLLSPFFMLLFLLILTLKILLLYFEQTFNHENQVI